MEAYCVPLINGLDSVEGDASVHYRVDDGVEVPTSGSAFEIDEMMRSPHPQPAYCSVRTFVKGRTKAKLEDKGAADEKVWEAFTLWKEERREAEEAAIVEQYPAGQPSLTDLIGPSPSDIRQSTLNASCNHRCNCNCSSCTANVSHTLSFACSSATTILG
ncbi:hypothetical protein FOZ62_028143, partial [Perkinsus olseni]